MVAEHGFFVGRVAVARIGQVHAGGHVFEDFKLGVQATGRFFGGPAFVAQRGDAGQRGQQCAVDQRHDAIEFGQSRVAGDGGQFVGDLADDFPQPLRLEDRHGFRQRAERRSRTAQQFLHLAQRASLLQAAERFDDRIEEVEQDQQAVLIEMQLAVARLVASAANVVQPLEQGDQMLKILKPGQFGFGHFFASPMCHAA